AAAGDAPAAGDAAARPDGPDATAHPDGPAAAGDAGAGHGVESGCGCRVGAAERAAPGCGLLGLALAALGLAYRRRRR
ncbi:MAG TPA: MYXO-CTERM sorting domain-containing protein, partial [Polyangia bacterium]